MAKVEEKILHGIRSQILPAKNRRFIYLKSHLLP